MNPMDIVSLILGGGSAIGGLFGRDTSNPNAQFGDINSPFYQQAQSQYFTNLKNSLNSSTPGTQQLLASQMAQGGDYGGSSYIANKQRDNITAHNIDAAGKSSANFLSDLFSRNMGIYAEGNMAKYQDQNSFANNLLGLGGGMFSRLLNPMNSTNNGQQSMFGMQNSNGYQVPNYMLDYMSPNTMGA